MSSDNEAFQRLVAIQKERAAERERSHEQYGGVVKDMSLGFIVGALAEAFFTRRK